MESTSWFLRLFAVSVLISNGIYIIYTYHILTMLAQLFQTFLYLYCYMYKLIAWYLIYTITVAGLCTQPFSLMYSLYITFELMIKASRCHFLHEHPPIIGKSWVVCVGKYLRCLCLVPLILQWFGNNIWLSNALINLRREYCFGVLSSLLIPYLASEPFHTCCRPTGLLVALKYSGKQSVWLSFLLIEKILIFWKQMGF